MRTVKISYKELCDDELFFFNKLCYNELCYKEYLVVTNMIFSPKIPFTAQINPFVINPGYNENIWSVLSCSL